MEKGLMIAIAKPEAKPSKGAKMYVPLSSLQVNDGNGDVAPEVGDEVNVPCVIESIEGENACIKPVNAVEQKEPDQPKSKTPPDLRSMAEEEDENY